MPCSRGRRCCMPRHHIGRNRQIRWPYFWRETRNNSGPSPRGPCMSMLCWMLQKESAGGRTVRLNQEKMTLNSLSLSCMAFMYTGIQCQGAAHQPCAPADKTDVASERTANRTQLPTESTVIAMRLPINLLGGWVLSLTSEPEGSVQVPEVRPRSPPIRQVAIGVRRRSSTIRSS